MIELTQEIVKELLHYDPDTGKLFWKPRESKWFKSGKRQSNSCSIWNNKYALKEAGCLSTYDNYLKIRILGKSYQLHRIIWLYIHGYWPDEIDHKNGKRDENTLTNIRNVSHQINMLNTMKQINNTSGHNGIVFHRMSRKFQAQIQYKNKNHYLGLFENLEEAIEVRKKAELAFEFSDRHGT